MNARAVLALLIVLLLAVGAMAWYAARPQAPAPVTPTEDWSATTTAPTSAEPDTTLSPLARRVVVASPRSGATVPSPFQMAGTAPGSWYFEASFPIIVTDSEGTKIATSHAEAQTDWMTEGDVPFTASIDVGQYRGPATVNLLRDNPSGLPENDDSTSFQIVIQ